MSEEWEEEHVGLKKTRVGRDGRTSGCVHVGLLERHLRRKRTERKSKRKQKCIFNLSALKINNK